MAHTGEFDLYLDESGTFMETSTEPPEIRETLRQNRIFASQLAGLLVPKGQMTVGRAREIRDKALKAGGLNPQPLHASELSTNSYLPVVSTVVREVIKKQWQPVRLVNRERARYGDRAATYTNLFAELILRICTQKMREGFDRLSLRIYPARVTLHKDEEGVIHFLEAEEYLRRIREYLGAAATRRGLASSSSWWSIDEFRIRSAKADAELQLCDVISHASHDDFHPCDVETRETLRAAFGQYDFTLAFFELIERVRQQLANDAPGLALLSHAERFSGDPMTPELRDSAEKQLGEIIAYLADLGASARDQHLAMLSGWLEQTIEVRRSLDFGLKACHWILTDIIPPLASLLSNGPDPHSIDWFRYALHTWALTACNHRGDARGAHRHGSELDSLLSALAGQWEHATLLMRGLVAQSVHLTDCFDHDNVAKRMKLVTSYYGELGGLFHVEMPEVFPEKVRSDLHGRALGTWLQSEIYAGLAQYDTERFTFARSLSDKAIDEFPGQSDQERQYQYRCQLETAAGEFAEARRFLALSLRLEAESHSALAQGIAAIDNPFAQGFAHLHWFRLGVTACLDNDSEESKSFLDAVAESKALDWPWSCLDGPSDYPVHGILRRTAVIQAFCGEYHVPARVLRRLGDLLSGEDADRFVLQAIRLAAHAEVASVLAPRKENQAKRILSSDRAERPGLLPLLEQMKSETESDFPCVWAVFEDWPQVASKAVQGDQEAYLELRSLARRVGY